jgi:NADH:ubiquinone oxidoreductase subunit 5 (subunit L)/multisubunit Na+/H+ antiporter MnhA subunit
MTTLLHLFIIIPLLGFLISLLVPRKREIALSTIAFITVGTQFAAVVIFSIYWLCTGHAPINMKDIVVFESGDYSFFIDFCFDKITAVYMLVGAFLTFLVTMYSRYYMHREDGYKRFFNMILFFYLGYNITVFSGNLETLFIGWEILGISSFLLIAFYRERYLPVKNAIKVFSIYRIGDIGLILAMWMAHHLFHENITFMQLKNDLLVHADLESHSLTGIFISLMILIAAAAKSAQLPFSSWLPRAMEGPTPSSAIFYGSLSVHMGVFLLLRTFELWEHQYSVRIIIAVLGLVTSIVTSGIARVQSNVKSQIAYSSISQIGLIFIELAAGFETLALIHFAGNAFLRTYQLLVSPSVVSYLIREQVYTYTPAKPKEEGSFISKLKNSFYVLCLKEWNLDVIMSVLWSPLKNTGRRLDRLTVTQVLIFFIPAYIIGLICLFNETLFPPKVHEYIPTLFSFIGFIMVLKAFTGRKNVMLNWTLIIMNHFWIALAVSFNEHFKNDQTLLYLSGIVVAGLIGYVCLNKVKSLEQNTSLSQYHGYSFNHPKLAFVFLLTCLGLTGFPITPTFVGEDVIFSHIHETQFGLAFFTASSLIIDGIAAIRIYAHLFMGPHVKTYGWNLRNF